MNCGRDEWVFPMSLPNKFPYALSGRRAGCGSACADFRPVSFRSHRFRQLFPPRSDGLENRLGPGDFFGGVGPTGGHADSSAGEKGQGSLVNHSVLLGDPDALVERAAAGGEMPLDRFEQRQLPERVREIVRILL